MIYAYAIEPACVVAWCDRRAFRLVFGQFGLGTPRVLLEFPKLSKWKRLVHDAAILGGLSELDKARLTELLKLLGTRPVRRVGMDYDGQTPWLDNAEREHTRHPFAAIIALENPRGHPAVLLESAVGDENHPLWHRPRAATPQRTPAEIGAALRAMIENCGELHLIDPHFGPENVRHRRVLEHLLGIVASRRSGRPNRICVHCSGEKGVTLSFFEQQCSEQIAHRTPAGITVQFKRWVRKDNGEKFHNRYLLTDLGGVVLGVGLDAGSASETDDVNLMDATQFELRWDQFNGAGAFELADEPAPIVGTKR